MAKRYSKIIMKRRTGIAFEEDLVTSMADHFKSTGDPGAIKYLGGTRIDREEGTDLTIWGVPIDITLNLQEKDHTKILPESTELLGGIKVRFGVRTGNRGHQFKTPVLVIGLDAMSGFVRAWENNIIQAFTDKLDEIIELGQSQYWDWCDANEV
jgi:hypothetical protein